MNLKSLVFHFDAQKVKYFKSIWHRLQKQPLAGDK